MFTSREFNIPVDYDHYLVDYNHYLVHYNYYLADYNHFLVDSASSPSKTPILGGKCAGWAGDLECGIQSFSKYVGTTESQSL